MASPVGWAARWGRAVSDQDLAAPWPVHAEPGPSPGQRALCLSCPIHPELPGHRAGAGHAPTLRGQAHGQASSWCGKALGLVCDSASAPGGAQAPEVRRSPCVTLREVRNINLHKMFYLIQRAARSHAHAASDETLSSSASSDSRVWHRAARRASPTKVLPGIVDWT
ncbi:uncharacterized protein LOC102155734 isoform X4 [Canis lupus familiaris]|uniref:uncharacterized protein LOC102155734 isoform X4 n=1 Tax=Canis lupus familiaris TaxID=9615 RepID=UPI0018F40A99|nr:uncharacterized protein LOC102155734 isoform X4 [Canis lupus familiaris]XP_038314007.1 uncharacterized protein LOC102155734 isoform X4 [Canis lupus familiaris]